MQASSTKKVSAIISHEELTRALSYDQYTGAFTWLVSTNRAIKVGSVAGNAVHAARQKSYRQIRFSGRNYYEHRLAWFYMTGKWPVNQVGHKDEDTANNRWANLREATASTNAHNRAKPAANNTAGFLGVSRNKAGKYTAKIVVNMKHFHLGTFATAELASTAYLDAKREKHDWSPL
jgi:hypothetical protein